MTVQITIIGTGQIGTSIGLALGEHKDLFFRLGHDKDFKNASQAKELGAFDRVERNLPASVAKAQVVILAIPYDQIYETLQLIAQDLQEDAVVMDTAPVKGQVLAWARELLPDRRYFIGLAPVLNPAYLGSPGHGIEAAHADLFQHGMMAVLPSQGVPSEAIKLATDFIHLLGAGHLFIDQVELDSMMSATQLLPQLLAAALLNSTVDQPGWADIRKLADRAYAEITDAIGPSTEVGSLSAAAISASDHLVRQIDTLVSNLDLLRDLLSAREADKLLKELSHASLGRERWIVERNSASWDMAENASKVELPSSKQVFARMFTFGGGRKSKPPK